jgi:threonine/homoserine/homoserine lactone efflux protein
MESVLKGVITGLALALLIGPVFFTLIQTSIERGFRSAFFVATGISLSDAFYIAIAYMGVYQLFDKTNMKYLAYCGGVILLLFGLYYIFVKSRKVAHGQEVKVRSPFRLILKGFIVNGLTPAVLLFWIATVSAAANEFGYITPGKALPYFAAIVATVFSTDLIKAKLADKLRTVITPIFVKRLNIILGVAMIVFGAQMIYNADNFQL